MAPFVLFTLFCLLASYFGDCSICKSEDLDILNTIGVLISLISMFLIWQYFKIPVISLTSSTFLVNKKTFKYSEISQIHIFAKCPNRFFKSFVKENGISVNLKSGSEIYFYESNYSNFHLLRHLLSIIRKDFSKDLPFNTDFLITLKNENQSDLSAEKFTRMDGNYYKTFGLLLLYFIPVFGFSLFEAEIYNLYEFLLPLTTMVLILLLFVQGRESYFVEISNNYIVFRNYIFFWTKKVFNISRLNQFELIDIQKVGNGFRVVDEDFKIYNFGCDTLTKEKLSEIEQLIQTHKNNIS